MWCWANLRSRPVWSGMDLASLRATTADARTDPKAIAVSRPLAKTITFRTIATVMDFTTTYIVIADAATAAALTAFGFVLGPFVYLGHEMLWDYYSAPLPPSRPGRPEAGAVAQIGPGL